MKFYQIRKKEGYDDDRFCVKFGGEWMSGGSWSCCFGRDNWGVPDREEVELN
jgi:hypothetical protein